MGNVYFACSSPETNFKFNIPVGLMAAIGEMLSG